MKKYGQPLEVCYSGGKDSDVILHLTKKAGVKYRAIYKNTTIDPPYTIRHAQEVGAEIVRPKMNFRQIIEEKGMPSRFQRFCCSILKEYKILDYAIIGVRRSESTKRAERYKEPEMCRTYSAKEKVRQYFPILEWDDNDVHDYIDHEGIRCHPLYYDEDGTFHVERRLGCMGCPLASHEKRRAEFMKYPKLLRLWIKAEQIYRNKKPRANFKDSYETMTFQLFCRTIPEFNERFGANMFFPAIDCKKFLEEYFHVSLD